MPKTCCSCRNAGDGYYEQSGDTCLWGGPCLNGWKPIVAAQLLATCGMLFSVATLADCSFVELGKRMFFPEDMDEDLPLKVTQTQYVGFLTWKSLDGSCYWYTSGSDWEGQLATFHEMLGYDWEKSFYSAAMSASLSFVFFCYVLSFTCSSQVRGVRYFNAVFLSLILTALQSITFLTFTSSLCDEYGCTFSRSAGLSAVAALFFFLSGLFFFGTTDYRGPKWNGERPALVPMRSVQVAPDHHSRDVSMPFSEEMQYSDVIERDAESFGSAESSGSADSDNVAIDEVMPDYDEEEIIEEEIVDDENDDENGVENGDDDGDENGVDGQDEEEVVETDVGAQEDAAEPAEPAETQEPEEEPKETQVEEGIEESKEEEAEIENSDVVLDIAAPSALEATTENDTNVEDKEEQIVSDENANETADATADETADATATANVESTETGEDAVAPAPPAPAATDEDEYTEITIDDSQR